MSRQASTYLGIFCVLLVAVLGPSYLGGQWVKILTSAACFAIAAAGVSMLYARLNMVSLAQVGLMGVGGWVMLRMNHGFTLPFEANLLVAVLVTAVFGVLLALPALRMRGLYLALVTLMAASGLEVIFSTFRFPNGGPGFWGVLPSVAAPFRRPYFAQSDEAYLSYCIIAGLLAFFFLAWVRRNAPGRAWALIQRSEAAAMASGIDVTRNKSLAFALSGALAGLAGGLLSGSLGMLDPATFQASESIMLFALCVVGGPRYWLGSVLAAVLYRVLPALFNNWGLDAKLSLVVFGGALLHAIVTSETGMAGQIHGLISKFAGGRLDRA
jgi:branched-chain amino acid transport system permease protein